MKVKNEPSSSNNNSRKRPFNESVISQGPITKNQGTNKNEELNLTQHVKKGKSRSRKSDLSKKCLNRESSNTNSVKRPKSYNYKETNVSQIINKENKNKIKYMITQQSNK